MRIAARPSCLLGLTALLTAASPAASQVIDTGTPPTVPNWPIFPFGRATSVSWATFGQSFTAPLVGPIELDAFTFWLRDNATTGSTPYHAYIFDWDPVTRRTGSTYLYRSAAQEYAGGTGWTQVSFSTGGLDVTPGESYIAVLSSTEFPGAPVGLRAGIGQSTEWPDDAYAGGESFTRPGPAGLATLTNNAWVLAGGTGDDLAFRATFSPAAVPTTAPEPGSAALLGAGVLGLALAARRRRR